MIPTTKMRAILFLNTLIFAGSSAAVIENTASTVVDWSMLNNIIEPPEAINSALNVVQRQTSQLASDIMEQSQQIRNQIDNLKATAVASTGLDFEYLRQASAALATASPEQLQLISDAMSMLGANYGYDAAQREMDLHRECIVAAFDDLSNATRIIVSSSGTIGGDASSDDYLQKMQRVKDYVLSAVQHLQDSCPLCRALKYAARDSTAAQNLLPFVTVLCSSVLKTLHPFLSSTPAPL